MIQKIEIVRGTTNTLEIYITDAYGNAYVLGSGQKVVFGVKKEKSDKELLLKKLVSTGTSGVYKVSIVPEDTAEWEPGKYWYDVGLLSDKNYYNVIEPNPFIVNENVTNRGDGE